MADPTYTIPPALAGETLSATLRKLDPALSWSAAKRLITGRRVAVNDTLATNDARRLAEGDRVTILAEAAAPVPREQSVRLLHIDPDVVVVDKPARILSHRPDEEKDFSDERKAQQPTLDELVQRLLPGSPRTVAKKRHGKQRAPRPAPLYVVHRLDRDTSGLMLFALSPRARDAFIDLFSRHAINRTYHAVCLGRLDQPVNFESDIIRDRGDQDLHGQGLEDDPLGRGPGGQPDRAEVGTGGDVLAGDQDRLVARGREGGGYLGLARVAEQDVDAVAG